MPVIGDRLSSLVARDYAVGYPDECVLIRGGFGVNDTYRVTVGDQRFVLRVQSSPPTKGWIAGDGDLRFELDLLAHLFRHGVPVATPLPRISGDLLGIQMDDGQEFSYSLFAWAPGEVVPDDRLTSDQARLVGEALAKVHLAADAFRSEHPRYRLDLEALLDKPLMKLASTLEDLSPADRRFVEEQVSDIRGRLDTFTRGPDLWGIIHGDIHSQNLHVTDDGSITLFDFDLCAYGWRAYDVAYYYTRIPATVRQFALDGYTSIRSLSDIEHDLLPTFGRAAWVWEGLRAPNLVARLRDPFL